MATDEMMRALRHSDALYERYVAPLELEHAGAFVAVFADGRMVIAGDLMDVADKALCGLDPGSYIFKIGECVVGRWR